MEEKIKIYNIYCEERQNNLQSLYNYFHELELSVTSDMFRKQNELDGNIIKVNKEILWHISCAEAQIKAFTTRILGNDENIKQIANNTISENRDMIRETEDKEKLKKLNFFKILEEFINIRNTINHGNLSFLTSIKESSEVLDRLIEMNNELIEVELFFGTLKSCYYKDFIIKRPFEKDDIDGIIGRFIEVWSINHKKINNETL